MGTTANTAIPPTPHSRSRSLQHPPTNDQMIRTSSDETQDILKCQQLCECWAMVPFLQQLLVVSCVARVRVTPHLHLPLRFNSVFSTHKEEGLNQRIVERWGPPTASELHHYTTLMIILIM